MNTLTTLIVEDEGLARRRLEKMVSNDHMLLLIEDSAISGKEALQKIEKYDPQLILMDIQLKDFDAFEVLEKARPYINGKIIFITAYDQYAIKAFELEAVDYLLKPFTEERFNKAIHKAIVRERHFNLENIQKALCDIRRPIVSTIVIPEGNTKHLLEERDIEYIYSQGYYVNIVTDSHKKLIRISLKLLEEILSPNFFRINKSTIINTTKIKQLIQHKNSIKIIMKDQNEFFVSDKYKTSLDSYFDNL